LVHENRVTYSWASVTEWFANGPLGLEQSFTLAHRPAGRGPLKISQAFSGDASPSVNAGGRGVTFTSHAGGLRYDDLLVTDATGARIPARLSVVAHRLVITIRDAGAVYPLRVDPTLHETAELTASDGAASDEFGISVAVSGSTIVAGAAGNNGGEGAVYVFSESAGGWAAATQTAELTASDGGDQLGSSVAVSGSTIVAGAAGRNTDRGAVYVFSEPAGGWANGTQTAELTASDGATGDFLGASVAVSGSTIVAGAPLRNSFRGAVYVFS
jgi:hypothetical protein